MKDKDRFVDQLLDSALLHHRAAQQRPGLEGRILERVRATAGEEIARGKAWKLWIAAAATVAVVTFVAIRVANRSHSPAVETSEAVNTVPSTSSKQTLAANAGATPKAVSTAPIVEPKPIAHRNSTRSRRVEAHRWPSQFPTPAPLTAEQKALVQYVRETPPQVLTASLFKQKSEDRPIEIRLLKIAPLEIQPLSVPSGGEQLQ